MNIDLKIQLTAVVLQYNGDLKGKLIPVVMGDRYPVLSVQWLNADGSVLDLTGLTPRISLRAKGDPHLMLDSVAMTVAAPTTGISTYALLAADITKPGVLEAELQLDHGAGGLQTLPDLVQLSARRPF